MVFSFARVSAVVGMNVEDYYQQGKRWWLRLQEKGGKQHEVPVHHNAEEYLDAYIAAAGIEKEKGSPLWRCVCQAMSIAAELTAAGLAPRNNLESGIAASLPPGLFTALLAGLSNGTGVGVIEVYDLGTP
jgi:integrase/recombinase XerD